MKITLASIIIGGLLVLAGLTGFDEAKKSKVDPAFVDITALENNHAL